MTTGKTIALTRWTFVGKAISLLIDMLSRLVIAFFSKKQASFNFVAVVTICSDFGAPEIKSDTVSTVCPSISHEVMKLFLINNLKIPYIQFKVCLILFKNTET